MLIFFIACLLYLLRFKRVDNLGAYSIPPETGLLIPIWLRQLTAVLSVFAGLLQFLIRGSGLLLV